MSFKRAITGGILSAALFVGGCASVSHENPPAVVIVVPAAIPAERESEFLDALDRQLRHSLDASAVPVLKPLARADESISMRLDGAGFAGLSGELDVATLAPLGEIAKALADAGACVIHVLGERVDAQEDADADLGERRAESVAAMLVRLGFPAARVRAESRVRSGAAGGVVIVVRPVIEHREQEAWMPPRIDS